MSTFYFILSVYILGFLATALIVDNLEKTRTQVDGNSIYEINHVLLHAVLWFILMPILLIQFVYMLLSIKINVTKNDKK